MSDTCNALKDAELKEIGKKEGKMRKLLKKFTKTCKKSEKLIQFITPLVKGMAQLFLGQLSPFSFLSSNKSGWKRDSKSLSSTAILLNPYGMFFDSSHEPK